MHRLLALAASALLTASVSGSEYRAGTGKVVITPQETMWAGGYGARNKPVSEKHHDLFARALVLEDAAGYRLVIVTTDLLGLPRKIADPVAEELMSKFRLRREQIVLSSTHTHSGPVLRDNLVDIYPMGPDGWKQIERYSDWLQPRIVQAVSEAMAALAPAQLAQGIGQCGFAVNRRENRERDVSGPQATKGPVDHDVPVLRVTAPDGRLRALLFGYACHNTVLDWYKWCGDYAGFAELGLEAAHPGATAMFFMGCGADQNPIPRRKVELAEKYGRQLADAVEEAVKANMKPVNGRFAAAFRRVDLPFAHVPSRQELESWTRSDDRYKKPMAGRLLARLDKGEAVPAAYAYPVQALQIGGDLTLVALAGEVVVDYSLRLKRELGREGTWVAGYCNDVFAYIPSRRVLAEGGYEGESSMGPYGLPSKWAPEVEEKVVAATHEVVDEVRTTAAKR